MLALNRSYHFSHSADSLPSAHSPFYDSEKDSNVFVVHWLLALKTSSVSASPESLGTLRELHERMPDFPKEILCDELKVLLERLEKIAAHDFLFDADLHACAEKAYRAVCSFGKECDPSFFGEKDPTPQRASPGSRVGSWV